MLSTFNFQLSSAMSKILAFNWKTNPNSLSEALSLFDSYNEPFKSLSTWDKIVFPPFVYIYELIKHVNDQKILSFIGSQDISEFESGAHTSQVSGKMLSDLGCEFTLIGHSETRSELMITSFDTANKIKASLENNLKPILCVGFEPRIEDQNIDYEELANQIQVAIQANVTELNKLESLIIAYEPTWAIGTGKIPTLVQIEKVIDFIISNIHDEFGADLSYKTKVLYGGSVNESNILELTNSTKISGFLIGGASLKPDQVQKMVLKLARI